MAKVAINGLGRSGRATLKIVLDEPALELVAINDLLPADNLAYLLNTIPSTAGTKSRLKPRKIA